MEAAMTFGWVPDRPDIRDFAICGQTSPGNCRVAAKNSRRKRAAATPVDCVSSIRRLKIKDPGIVHGQRGHRHGR
jgi:hypothetical protein